MKSKLVFKPAVIGLDRFNQSVEIARLREWTERTPSASPQVLRQGIAKFLALDLLRYGHLTEVPSLNPGFGVIRQSTTITLFIRKEIQSKHAGIASILEMLADGDISVDVGEFESGSQFVFYALEDKEEALAEPAGQHGRIN